MSRIEAPGLPEFRRRVSEQMAAMGWPMYEDDEGAVMLKLDGLLDVTITATLSVVNDLYAQDPDDPDPSA